MIGELFKALTDSIVPTGPAQTGSKKPKKRLRFSDLRREIWPLALTTSGISTIIDYIGSNTPTGKVRLTKGVLRTILGLLNLFYRAPKKKT